MTKRILVAIAFVALAVRLTVLSELADSALFEIPLGDSRAFSEWGHAIASGDWFGAEVFYQAPLYAYFLGVIEALGGDVNAYTSLDETVIHATVLAPAAPAAIDALLGPVLKPRFDPTQLAAEVEVVVEEIRQDRDDPGACVQLAHRLQLEQLRTAQR